MAGILHLSDIHFGCENKAAVAAAAACAASEAFDLIVITGDITQYGRRAEFQAARAFVEALPQPVLLTPGNHDTPYVGMVARAFAPFARYERHLGPAWADAFDADGLAVRAFNSSRGMQRRLNWSKGVVDLQHAEAAAATFTNTDPGALRVAICHHPLMEVVGGPMTGKVHRGAAAADILAHAGVDLILTGHVHTPFAITLPCADGLTHGVGAATLSLRERGMPAGFNKISWDEESVIVKAQGWTGSHYETLRTWALPRRRRDGRARSPAPTGPYPASHA